MIFNRPLTPHEFLQWVLRYQPHQMGFQPNDRALRQPPPITANNATHSETLRYGVR
jgi:hypothetical protein